MLYLLNNKYFIDINYNVLMEIIVSEFLGGLFFKVCGVLGRWLTVSLLIIKAKILFVYEYLAQKTNILPYVMIVMINVDLFFISR